MEKKELKYLFIGIVIGLAIHWIYIYNKQTVVFYSSASNSCYFQSSLLPWEHKIEFRDISKFDSNKIK